MFSLNIRLYYSEKSLTVNLSMVDPHKLQLKHLLALPPISPFPYSAILGGMLLLILINTGCSRSPWIKTDGHEVSPTEHVQCAQKINQNSNGEVLEQDVLTQRIEQCMLDNGYKRRPWWLLNDLRWDIK